MNCMVDVPLVDAVRKLLQSNSMTAYGSERC